MNKVKSVEELEVFIRSHQIVLEIYKMTKTLPRDEQFGLIQQMRRAAVSICANLYEGAHRLSSKEYRTFVGYSRGSTGEMIYYMLLARDLGYISNDQYCNITERLNIIGKMLTRLAESLSKKVNHR